jgi:hypothetical protein
MNKALFSLTFLALLAIALAKEKVRKVEIMEYRKRSISRTENDSFSDLSFATATVVAASIYLCQLLWVHYNSSESVNTDVAGN